MKPTLPKCIFCNADLEEDLFNGAYGCDTGCEYVTIEIECPNCRKIVGSSGEFGYYSSDQEREEYRENFLCEFAQEMERLQREKASNNL